MPHDASHAPDKVAEFLIYFLHLPWYVPASVSLGFFGWWSWTVWKAFNAIRISNEMAAALTRSNSMLENLQLEIVRLREIHQATNQKVFEWERTGSLMYHALPRIAELREKAEAGLKAYEEGAPSVTNEATMNALTNHGQRVSMGGVGRYAETFIREMSYLIRLKTAQQRSP